MAFLEIQTVPLRTVFVNLVTNYVDYTMADVAGQ